DRGERGGRRRARPSRARPRRVAGNRLMRLQAVERGHRLPQKVIIAVIRLTSGERGGGIIRTNFYPPEVFGPALRAWTQAVMRGPSPWNVWERELFAAFVSHLNKCRF